MRPILLLSCVAFALFFALPAHAQSEGAEAHFREGVEASRAHRWADATRAFRAAFERSGRSELLINIATSLAEQGRWADAREAYRRFLNEAPERVRATHRASVLDAIARAETRAARLSISIEPRGPGRSLWIDGREVSLDGDGWVDAGIRRVELRDGAGVIAEQVVIARPGEVAFVRLRPSPVSLELSLTPESSEIRGEASGEDPLILGLITAGLVVLAAGIAVGLGVEISRDRGFVGNFGPGRWVVALR